MMYRREDYSDDEEAGKKQNFSELEKIVQYVENTYLLVKENGIKSTVNFQLDQMRLKKKEEESLPELEQ